MKKVLLLLKAYDLILLETVDASPFYLTQQHPIFVAFYFGNFGLHSANFGLHSANFNLQSSNPFLNSINLRHVSDKYTNERDGTV